MAGGRPAGAARPGRAAHGARRDRLRRPVVRRRRREHPGRGDPAGRVVHDGRGGRVRLGSRCRSTRSATTTRSAASSTRSAAATGGSRSSGAKSGGAHGNPRVRTFYGTARRRDWPRYPRRTSTCTAAPAQVSVNRMAGGPEGWLIAGNRDGGAAVWNSPDATRFTIVGERAGAGQRRGALHGRRNDAVAVDAGWLIVGSGRPTGRIDRDPLAWTSPDGRTLHPGAAAGRPPTTRWRSGCSVRPTGSSPSAWPARASRPGGATASGAWRLAGGGPVRRDRRRDGRRRCESGRGRWTATSSPRPSAADGHRLWSGDLAGNGWRPVDLPVPVPTGRLHRGGGRGDRAARCSCWPTTACRAKCGRLRLPVRDHAVTSADDRLDCDSKDTVSDTLSNGSGQRADGDLTVGRSEWDNVPAQTG